MFKNDLEYDNDNKNICYIQCLECINTGDNNNNNRKQLKKDILRNNNSIKNKNKKDVKKEKEDNKEIVNMKDNKFLRGTKNNNLSSSISNNSLNHPGSKSGRKENSNIINIISAPDDDNNNNVKEVTKGKNNANVKSWQQPQSAMFHTTKGMNMQQQQNHDLVIKKQHRFIKSWQHHQIIISHVPAFHRKLPTTKHRHHTYSTNASRRLDSSWGLVVSAISGAASSTDEVGRSVSTSANCMTVA